MGSDDRAEHKEHGGPGAVTQLKRWWTVQTQQKQVMLVLCALFLIFTASVCDSSKAIQGMRLCHARLLLRCLRLHSCIRCAVAAGLVANRFSQYMYAPLAAVTSTGHSTVAA